MKNNYSNIREKKLYRNVCNPLYGLLLISVLLLSFLRESYAQDRESLQKTYGNHWIFVMEAQNGTGWQEAWKWYLRFRQQEVTDAPKLNSSDRFSFLSARLLRDENIYRARKITRYRLFDHITSKLYLDPRQKSRWIRCIEVSPHQFQQCFNLWLKVPLHLTRRTGFTAPRNPIQDLPLVFLKLKQIGTESKSPYKRTMVVVIHRRSPMATLSEDELLTNQQARLAYTTFDDHFVSAPVANQNLSQPEFASVYQWIDRILPVAPSKNDRRLLRKWWQNAGDLPERVAPSARKIFEIRSKHEPKLMISSPTCNETPSQELPLKRWWIRYPPGSTRRGYQTRYQFQFCASSLPWKLHKLTTSILGIKHRQVSTGQWSVRWEGDLSAVDFRRVSIQAILTYPNWLYPNLATYLHIHPQLRIPDFPSIRKNFKDSWKKPDINDLVAVRNFEKKLGQWTEQLQKDGQLGTKSVIYDKDIHIAAQSFSDRVFWLGALLWISVTIFLLGIIWLALFVSLLWFSTAIPSLELAPGLNPGNLDIHWSLQGAETTSKVIGSLTWSIGWQSFLGKIIPISYLRPKGYLDIDAYVVSSSNERFQLNRESIQIYRENMEGIISFGMASRSISNTYCVCLRPQYLVPYFQNKCCVGSQELKLFLIIQSNDGTEIASVNCLMALHPAKQGEQGHNIIISQHTLKEKHPYRWGFDGILVGRIHWSSPSKAAFSESLTSLYRLEVELLPNDGPNIPVRVRWEQPSGNRVGNQSVNWSQLIGNGSDWNKYCLVPNIRGPQDVQFADVRIFMDDDPISPPQVTVRLKVMRIQLNKKNREKIAKSWGNEGIDNSLLIEPDSSNPERIFNIEIHRSGKQSELYVFASHQRENISNYLDVPVKAVNLAREENAANAILSPVTVSFFPNYSDRSSLMSPEVLHLHLIHTGAGFTYHIRPTKCELVKQQRCLNGEPIQQIPNTTTVTLFGGGDFAQHCLEIRFFQHTKSEKITITPQRLGEWIHSRSTEWNNAIRIPGNSTLQMIFFCHLEKVLDAPATDLLLNFRLEFSILTTRADAVQSQKQLRIEFSVLLCKNSLRVAALDIGTSAHTMAIAENADQLNLHPEKYLVPLFDYVVKRWQNANSIPQMSQSEKRMAHVSAEEVRAYITDPERNRNLEYPDALGGGTLVWSAMTVIRHESDPKIKAVKVPPYRDDLRRLDSHAKVVQNTKSLLANMVRPELLSWIAHQKPHVGSQDLISTLREMFMNELQSLIPDEQMMGVVDILYTHPNTLDPVLSRGMRNILQKQHDQTFPSRYRIHVCSESDAMIRLVARNWISNNQMIQDGFRLTIIDIGAGTTDITTADFSPGNKYEHRVAFRLGVPLAGSHLTRRIAAIVHDHIKDVVKKYQSQYPTLQYQYPLISQGTFSPENEQMNHKNISISVFNQIEEWKKNGCNGELSLEFSGDALPISITGSLHVYNSFSKASILMKQNQFQFTIPSENIAKDYIVAEYLHIMNKYLPYVVGSCSTAKKHANSHCAHYYLLTGRASSLSWLSSMEDELQKLGMKPLFAREERSLFLPRLKDGVVLGALLSCFQQSNITSTEAVHEQGLGAGTICVIFRSGDSAHPQVLDLAPFDTGGDFPVVSLTKGAREIELRFDPARIVVSCLRDKLHLDNAQHIKEIVSYRYQLDRNLESSNQISLQLRSKRNGNGGLLLLVERDGVCAEKTLQPIFPIPSTWPYFPVTLDEKEFPSPKKSRSEWQWEIQPNENNSKLEPIEQGNTSAPASSQAMTVLTTPYPTLLSNDSIDELWLHLENEQNTRYHPKEGDDE